MNLGDPFRPVVNTTHDDYCTSGSVTDRGNGIAVVYIGSRTAVVFLLIVRFVGAQGPGGPYTCANLASGSSATGPRSRARVDSGGEALGAVVAVAMIER